MSVCDTLNISVVEGKSFCSSYGDCAIISQKHLFVAMEFTQQVSAFAAMELEGSSYNAFLWYYGNSNTCPRAVPSNSDDYQP